MKRRTLLVALGLAAGASAVIGLTGGSALAGKTTSTTSSGLIVGTWDCVTTFLSGPQAGQTENLRFIFQANGTLNVEAGNLAEPAYGCWFWEQNRLIYSFTEKLIEPPGFEVRVAHIVTSLKASSFTSYGQGFVFSGGQFVFNVRTRTDGKK